MDLIWTVLITLVFIALTVYAVWKGEAPMRRGMKVSRARYPVAFWLVIAAYLTIAAITLYIGVQAFLKTTTL